MKWTYSDIKKLQDKGMEVKGFEGATKPEPAGLKYIKEVLERENIRYETEYKFDSKRRFRFDIFLTDLKVGIEYEGLVSEKSRHTTLEGYSKDCSKYNLASLSGLKVLRYTAFNYNEFDIDVLLIT